MQVYPIFIEQQAALGATHMALITYADLTAATNTQTLALLTQKANVMGMRVTNAVVVTPFVSSDASDISLAFTVGDSGSATRYMASLETNANATTPTVAEQGAVGALTDATAYYATADTAVNAYVTCTSGKLLSAFTAGYLIVFFKITDNRFQG